MGAHKEQEEKLGVSAQENVWNAKRDKISQIYLLKKKNAKFLYLEVYHEVISCHAVVVQYLRGMLFVLALFAEDAFLIHPKFG